MTDFNAIHTYLIKLATREDSRDEEYAQFLRNETLDMGFAMSSLAFEGDSADSLLSQADSHIDDYTEDRTADDILHGVAQNRESRISDPRLIDDLPQDSWWTSLNNAINTVLDMNKNTIITKFGGPNAVQRLNKLYRDAAKVDQYIMKVQTNFDIAKKSYKSGKALYDSIMGLDAKGAMEALKGLAEQGRRAKGKRIKRWGDPTDLVDHSEYVDTEKKNGKTKKTFTGATENLKAQNEAVNQVRKSEHKRLAAFHAARIPNVTIMPGSMSTSPMPILEFNNENWKKDSANSGAGLMEKLDLIPTMDKVFMAAHGVNVTNGGGDGELTEEIEEMLKNRYHDGINDFYLDTSRLRVTDEDASLADGKNDKLSSKAKDGLKADKFDGKNDKLTDAEKERITKQLALGTKQFDDKVDGKNNVMSEKFKTQAALKLNAQKPTALQSDGKNDKLTSQSKQGVGVGKSDGTNDVKVKINGETVSLDKRTIKALSGYRQDVYKAYIFKKAEKDSGKRFIADNKKFTVQLNPKYNDKPYIKSFIALGPNVNFGKPDSMVKDQILDFEGISQVTSESRMGPRKNSAIHALLRRLPDFTPNIYHALFIAYHDHKVPASKSDKNTMGTTEGIKEAVTTSFSDMVVMPASATKADTKFAHHENHFSMLKAMFVRVDGVSIPSAKRDTYKVKWLNREIYKPSSTIATKHEAELTILLDENMLLSQKFLQLSGYSENFTKSGADSTYKVETFKVCDTASSVQGNDMYPLSVFPISALASSDRQRIDLMVFWNIFGHDANPSDIKLTDNTEAMSSFKPISQLVNTPETNVTMPAQVGGKVIGFNGERPSYRAVTFEDIRFLGISNKISLARDDAGTVSITVPFIYRSITQHDSNFLETFTPAGS